MIVACNALTQLLYSWLATVFSNASMYWGASNSIFLTPRGNLPKRSCINEASTDCLKKDKKSIVSNSSLRPILVQA
ncbi:TPA: hypothetical protein ACG3Q9_003782 [Clostridioides difficile]